MIGKYFIFNQIDDDYEDERKWGGKSVILL